MVITQPASGVAASSPPTAASDAPQAPMPEPVVIATARDVPGGLPESRPGREDAPVEAQHTGADEHLPGGASGVESVMPREDPKPKGMSSQDARLGAEAQEVDLRREDSDVQPPAAPALSQSSSSILGARADGTKPKVHSLAIGNDCWSMRCVVWTSVKWPGEIRAHGEHVSCALHMFLLALKVEHASRSAMLYPGSRSYGLHEIPCCPRRGGR